MFGFAKKSDVDALREQIETMNQSFDIEVKRLVEENRFLKHEIDKIHQRLDDHRNAVVAIHETLDVPLKDVQIMMEFTMKNPEFMIHCQDCVIKEEINQMLEGD